MTRRFPFTGIPPSARTGSRDGFGDAFFAAGEEASFAGVLSFALVGVFAGVDAAAEAAVCFARRGAATVFTIVFFGDATLLGGALRDPIHENWNSLSILN